MRRGRSLVILTTLTLIAPVGAYLAGPTALALPNPVATNEETYQAFGRVFPDPHGCLAYGAPDADGDGVKDTPRSVSPWAKGRLCADQFLQYEEVVNGARFLAQRFPEFAEVLKVSQFVSGARSAGIPRTVAVQNGGVEVLSRDRRPLYMFRVTDERSRIPERAKKHFAYTLSIHGIERAGLEGGARAMEDLVTWAACERKKYLSNTPACDVEGPFPKKIVETPSKKSSLTAGKVLDKAVVYFVLPNPDGWARGQVAPLETRNGNVNVNYSPGIFFQRYNGNGVDLNRDWPTVGYTYKPYSPGSEPETRSFRQALSMIRGRTKAGRFEGGIDLHGMITAHAFSYTLLGSGQRDYRKNALSVDTSLRAWEDQTKRLAWSPYVADANANGKTDGTERCVVDPNPLVGGTRGHLPACVADEWGTVIDTLGYQVTGSLGDWIDSPLGLNGVGIDNEMYASHLAPNTVFDPALEQTHIDGNKGLIYSQLTSLLTADRPRFVPRGDVGYVFNPTRIRKAAGDRIKHPGLPHQEAINVLLPCQTVERTAPDGCGSGEFANDGGSPTYEFTVKGPRSGYWNGGLYITSTRANVAGISDGNVGQMQLQHFDEGQWHTVVSDFNQSFLYAQAGQVTTVNDPQPGRWRVWFELPSHLPARVKIGFRKAGEAGAVQHRIDASSMDFFTELNRYVPPGRDLERIGVERVLNGSLRGLDSLIVVNKLGSPKYLRDELGLSSGEVERYFNRLASFAKSGGNLVLTDAALQAASQIGLVGDGAIAGEHTLAGSYFFKLAGGTLTYRKTSRFPLARGVGKPGAAEQEEGRRQAAEPAPLGYSPDTGMDADPAMPFWGIELGAWNKACELARCVTALTNPFKGAPHVALGQARLGRGRVRIVGVMFPDPVYSPDESNDHRFGLASYALTYTAYEVFENLIDFKR